MIDIINIHKSYGSLEVLKGINAHIDKGEIVSIVGPSGAGKTTLLQIIGTLDKPDREIKRERVVCFPKQPHRFCISVSPITP